MRVPITATGFWPYNPTSGGSNAAIEGGTTDRRGRQIYTLEGYLDGGAPWVSLAGDFRIWPDGQLVYLDAWPDVPFRIVDTGGSFYGSRKLYRTVGREPIDVAVDSARTTVPRQQWMRVVVGDALAAGAARTPYTPDRALLAQYSVQVDDQAEESDGGDAAAGGDAASPLSNPAAAVALAVAVIGIALAMEG